MKKKLTALLAAALSLTMVSGCSAARKLPEGMDEEAVSQAAQALVTQLLAGEYEAVAAAFRDDLEQELSITAQTVADLMATVEEAGAYIGTDEVLVLGGSSKNFDEPYAAVAIYCEHEEGDVIYELSLDMDLELIGLRAKER